MVLLPQSESQKLHSMSMSMQCILIRLSPRRFSHPNFLMQELQKLVIVSALPPGPLQSPVLEHFSFHDGKEKTREALSRYPNSVQLTARPESAIHCVWIADFEKE